MKKASKKAGATSGKKQVKFQLAADPGSEVYLTGSFNEWKEKDKTKMLKEGPDGIYSARFFLQKGRHEYKFIVNDVWCVDPSCQEWTPNGLGSINSVLEV